MRTYLRLPKKRILTSLTVALSTVGVGSSTIDMNPARAGATSPPERRIIVTVEESTGSLEAAFGMRVTTAAAPETPILQIPGFDPASSVDWRSSILASGLSLREVGGELHLAGPDLDVERTRSEERRLPAHPVPPSSGDPSALRTGAVYLYGEAIDPPYRLDASDAGVRLNGVPVLPVPGPMRSAPDPDPTQRGHHDTMSGALDTWNGATDDPRLLADLIASPAIADARWIDETEIELVHVDGSVETLVLGGLERSAPSTTEQDRAYFASRAASIRRLLRVDGVVAIGASYVVPVPEATSRVVREHIEEVRRSAQSEARKLLEIQALIGDREAAADILFAE